MPIKPIHLILLLTLLLAGCAPAAAVETPTPIPSRTASQTAAPTRTPTVTLTPVPPTATNTLTPTLSPTISMTPLPFNACPVADEEYQYPFPEEVDETEKLAGDILEALNHGMTLTNLQNSLSQIEIVGDMFPPRSDEGKPLPYLNTFAQDLTGDEVTEIVFINRKIENFLLPWTLHVFSCQ